MRGFVSGIVWGVAVSGVALGTTSLIAPLAPQPKLESDMAALPASPKPDDGAVAAMGQDADLVEQKPAQPSQPTQTNESPGALAQSDVAREPDAATQTQRLADPAKPLVQGEMAMASEQPVSLPQQGSQPQAPATGTDLPEAETRAERLPAPDLSSATEDLAQTKLPVEEAPDVVSRSDQIPSLADAASTITPATPDATPETPPAAQQAPDVGDAPSMEVAAVSVKPDLPQGSPTQVPQLNPEPEQPSVPETPEATPSVDGTVPAAPVRVLRPNQSAAQGGVTIGTPVVRLTDRDDKGAAVQSAAPSPAPALQPGDGPPLDVYAVAFENPDEKPLMSIVLIDDADSVGIEALADFPYPLSFAIDPLAPDAADKIARHREAGFEVVALVDLPEAATAQDAEVSLSVLLDAAPQSVAVMEGTGSGVQGNRSLSNQVAAFAGATGRGLITQGNGLNTVQKLALREGIPAAVVFRDFDGAGQSPTVMRRFLDQAAFRAGQEGAVIMMGRVRPDTVSALLLWGLQDRASRVALAPVSAVLKGSLEGG